MARTPGIAGLVCLVVLARLVVLAMALGDSGTVYLAGNPDCIKTPVTPGPTSTPGGLTKTPTPTGTPCATPSLTPTATATTPTPTSVPKARGDVNDDGQLNSIDAELILQLSAGLISTLPNLASADVNHSETADAVDATLILQFVAGLIPGLPVPKVPTIPEPTVQGVPTITASGLQIYDIQVGTGTAARASDSVTVNYRCWLADGTTIDSSSFHGGPLTFPLTALILGWQEGVPGMRVGGKRRLIIPPALGYGAVSVGKIPPNSTLIFDIELVSIP